MRRAHSAGSVPPFLGGLGGGYGDGARLWTQPPPARRVALCARGRLGGRWTGLDGAGGEATLGCSQDLSRLGRAKWCGKERALNPLNPRAYHRPQLVAGLDTRRNEA